MLRSAFVCLSLAVVASSHLRSSESSEEGNSRNKIRADRTFRGPDGSHNPEPPFMEDLAEEDKKVFFDLLHDRELSHTTRKEKALQWAEKHGVKREVADHFAVRKAFIQEFRKNTTEAISQLPVAFAAIQSYMADKTLTRRQAHDKVHALMKSYSPELRALLEGARPRFGHHHKYGYIAGPMKRPKHRQSNESAENKKEDSGIDTKKEE